MPGEVELVAMAEATRAVRAMRASATAVARARDAVNTARRAVDVAQRNRRSLLVRSPAPEPSEELLRLRAENGALARATESRSVIDVAKGLLMARLGCTGDQAFALLRTQSQYENVKLRDIAHEIVARAEAQQGG